MQEESSVVSAGGKVLVIGGYLITQRPLPGYVLSVDARLYVSVTALHFEPQSEFSIQVESPQFGTTHHYALLVAPKLSLKLIPR